MGCKERGTKLSGGITDKGYIPSLQNMIKTNATYLIENLFKILLKPIVIR